MYIILSHMMHIWIGSLPREYNTCKKSEWSVRSFCMMLRKEKNINEKSCQAGCPLTLLVYQNLVIILSGKKGKLC